MKHGWGDACPSVPMLLSVSILGQLGGEEEPPAWDGSPRGEPGAAISVSTHSVPLCESPLVSKTKDFGAEAQK